MSGPLPILVLGRSGQVAQMLARRAAQENALVMLRGRGEIDLLDQAAIMGAIRDVGAATVINAAAYTAVDKAESEPEAAWRLNTQAPGVMAEACRACGVPLLHVSTDYVFDGSKTAPYLETDVTAPLGVYGQTKLAGEKAIQERYSRHIVLRTSWVFSDLGTNFVRTMLNLGRSRPLLKIVDDQVGGPTAAGDIAQALLTIARHVAGRDDLWGIYNFAGAPEVTWCGFAREIFRQAGLTPAVEPIETREYPTPAKRPANSILDCSRIAANFGLPQPDWRLALAEIVPTLERNVQA